jgi:hypothetical protein
MNQGFERFAPWGQLLLQKNLTSIFAFSSLLGSPSLRFLSTAISPMSRTYSEAGF